MVEAELVGDIHELVVIHREAHPHEGIAHDVGKIGAEVFLAHQILHIVVADGGADESIEDAGSLSLPLSIQHQIVTTVNLIGKTGFHAIVGEEFLFGAALRVVGETAVAHVAHAPHLGSGGVQAHMEIDMAVGELGRGPEVLLEDVVGVVVAELVAHAEVCANVVEVVVQQVGIFRTFTIGVLVFVQPVGTAQQIVDGLVIALVIATDVDTAGELDIVSEVGHNIRGTRHLHMVDDAVFHDILSALVGGSGQLVHLIEVVPVELAEVAVVQPLVGVPRLQGGVVGDVAGQVPVVVGTRVRHVGPVERGGALAAEAASYIRGNLIFAIFRGKEMREHEHRLVGVADAGVAFLAVVPAPVGVVVVVAGQVVHLLCRVALQTLGGGRAPQREVEGMLVVDAFFCREEVGEARVGAAVCVAQLAAEARGGGGGERPAVLHQAGGVGKHDAVVVVAVAQRVVGMELMAIIGGAGAVVGGATHIAEVEGHGVEVCHILGPAEHAVEAAPLGVGGAPRHKALHLQPVDGDGLVLRVDAACLEVGDAEGVRGVAAVDVARRVQQSGHEAAGGRFLIVETLRVEGGHISAAAIVRNAVSLRLIFL